MLDDYLARSAAVGEATHNYHGGTQEQALRANSLAGGAHEVSIADARDTAMAAIRQYRDPNSRRPPTTVPLRITDSRPTSASAG